MNTPPTDEFRRDLAAIPQHLPRGLFVWACRQVWEKHYGPVVTGRRRKPGKSRKCTLNLQPDTCNRPPSCTTTT